MIRRLTLMTLVALLAQTGTAVAADDADLKVTKGSVKVKGGKLKGSFVVKNKGGDKSKRTAAALNVVVPGKDLRAASYRERPLKPGGSHEARINVPVPSGAPAGAAVEVCADAKDKVDEAKEKNNCRKLGSIGGGGGSSVPNDPISYEKEVPFELQGPQSPYWIYIPSSYDDSHQTPTKLFLWMHGCGGDSGGDIYNVSPGGAQDWISISLGGRDGACWNMEADQEKVLGAIADVKTHFNVSAREVILGGYSSGGDLAYRTAFYNSRQIAGVLAEDTTPFRDTGSSQQDSIAAASHKFDVVHLLHLQDTTYPKETVRAETEAMKAAGFPLQRIEVDGTHYDNPGAIVNGNPVPGTDADVGIHLLPHIGDGWTSPG
jgi:predicted esterase